MIQDSIIRLIVIEESANDAEVILSSLRKARFPIRPKHVEDEEDLQAALSEQEWDLLITVPTLGDLTVRRICELVTNAKQDIPVLALCESVTSECMANLFGEGARQVLPEGNDAILQVAVQRELQDGRDRREKCRLEHIYRQLQQQNMSLLETSRDAIAYVHDGMHIHANPSYLDMFGYKNLDDLEAMPVMDLVAPESHAEFKEFMREYMTDTKEEDRDIQLIGIRSDKKRFKLKMEVSNAIYDNERCIQIIIRDQGDSHELERKLKEQDQLTGLYNRQHFIHLLEKALTKAAEARTRSVLLYVALDNFPETRDRVGIGAIDPVIINVANILKQHNKDVMSARFAEGVFTLLLVGKDVEAGRALADQIRQEVETCVTDVGEQSVVVTCSVGISQVLAAAATPQNVLNDAHAACQEAIKQGGNHTEVYKAVVKDESGGINITEVAKMIETAIEEKRLSLVYQPIVSLRGDSEELFDVYLRMVDSEGKKIPAGTLFAAAEQANLSMHLDKWVLKEAVTVMHQRYQTGRKPHLFVKLSDQAVKDENLVLYINKLLKASQIPPDALVVEISESVAISHIKQAKAFVTSLKKMQCRTALEHFGTGLDPKTTLTHLPVEYVKIDSSYAKGLSSNAENQDKVKALVELAHSFQRQTIAEAVEDANSLTILFQCDMDLAQGHYIQEPMDTLEFEFTED